VDRTPLPINVNAFLTWNQDPHPLKNDQAARAASLITASAAFHRTLRDGHLKPDIFHTKPKLSEHPLFAPVVRCIPPQLSWFAGYAVGAYALDMFQYDR
jgi:carnitine O-palmitoyltransferase 2